jgi:primosomal protein N' (replication factor Y) (superfamily II helicase)
LYFHRITVMELSIMPPPTPKIACVAFPMALSGVFDYEIPEALAGDVSPGMPVLVELRSRKLWGVAVRIKDTSTVARLKPVLDVRKDRWRDADASLIRLYEWIASYYQCDLGRVFRPFIRKGFVEAREKSEAVFRVAPGPAPGGLTRKQATALGTLAGRGGEFTRVECAEAGVGASLVAALCAKGALVKDERRVFREPAELRPPAGGRGSVELLDEQRAALDAIVKDLAAPGGPFLLYGITGSGKTHVYIEAARAALDAGRGVIILVPEISLTPQTIGRFRSELGDVIAVIHSRMSDGERRDSLAELVTGKRRLVIGVRSAVLVPVANLGLVIVDEEHDHSYKQSDLEPRYNARDVAVMRGRLQGATVVLGSATPSLESFRNARAGKYRLLTLTRRFGDAVLPPVTVVDMKEEHRENNWTLLSRHLAERMERTLANGRQVILLINRRGFSTFLVCKECGRAYTCPNCSVNLVFHKSELRLKCHQCGREEPAPSACPACRGEQIRFKGSGIQKAEEFVASRFPSARILRMDQDTTRKKGGHVDIIGKFERREADILIGTQMVAKGLNFPGVALVGVLAADIGLHVPDFRSSEKTFQLLAQVAGRAGRADAAGEVVVQTYFPDEPAVRAAANHDFMEFYNQEITGREELGYPPFGKLTRIVGSGAGARDVVRTLDAAARLVRGGWPGRVTVLGPSPAVLSKLKNEHRYSLLLKAPSARALGEAAAAVRAEVRPPKTVRLVIDVDPLNMM